MTEGHHLRDSIVFPIASEVEHYRLYNRWSDLQQAYIDWYLSMPDDKLLKQFGIVKDFTRNPPIRQPEYDAWAAKHYVLKLPAPKDLAIAA